MARVLDSDVDHYVTDSDSTDSVEDEVADLDFILIDRIAIVA